MLRGIFRQAWVRWTIGIVGSAIGVPLLAFKLSPRPGSAVIRYLFERDAAEVKRAMQAHAPQGVTAIVDQPYRPGDIDAQLDVYVPAALDQPGVRLPTLIWTHGGAWLSGYKDDAAPYFQLIASQGYTVISLEYSLAPGKTYPTAIYQVNDALAYIQENAARFHVDVGRIVMAGDSAGAQITSQIAVLITNPTYATAFGLRPALRREQLRGVVLYCGFYDMASFVERGQLSPTRLIRWGSGTMVWAYTGSHDRDSAALRQMSTRNHVTADFPPAFFSGGNGDPLSDGQSRPMVARLQELGVDVSTLFFPPEHEPALGHEYQFKLDNVDGQLALAQTLAFLKRHIGRGSLTAEK